MIHQVIKKVLKKIEMDLKNGTYVYFDNPKIFINRQDIGPLNDFELIEHQFLERYMSGSISYILCWKNKPPHGTPILLRNTITEDGTFNGKIFYYCPTFTRMNYLLREGKFFEAEYEATYDEYQNQYYKREYEAAYDKYQTQYYKREYEAAYDEYQTQYYIAIDQYSLALSDLVTLQQEAIAIQSLLEIPGLLEEIKIKRDLRKKLENKIQKMETYHQNLKKYWKILRNDFNDRLELYDQINGEGIYDPNRFPLDLD